PRSRATPFATRASRSRSSSRPTAPPPSTRASWSRSTMKFCRRSSPPRLRGARSFFGGGRVGGGGPGAGGAVDVALGDAACVVRERLSVGRQTAAPMEARGVGAGGGRGGGRPAVGGE